MKIDVVPEPEQNYEGRQWGYTVTLDDVPYLRVSTGGTGTCWNVEMEETDPQDRSDTAMHVCELDDLIAALTALRDSPAHAEHAARWA